jgi:hypothetical protein
MDPGESRDFLFYGGLISMATLHIEGFPDEVLRQAKSQAAWIGLTLKEYMIMAAKRMDKAVDKARDEGSGLRRKRNSRRGFGRGEWPVVGNG